MSEYKKRELKRKFKEKVRRGIKILVLSFYNPFSNFFKNEFSRRGNNDFNFKSTEILRAILTFILIFSVAIILVGLLWYKKVLSYHILLEL